MRFPLFVPILVCLTLNTFSLFAQSPNGNINGLVSDPSTAAVVGAEVVAVNDVTGVQYTTKSNSEGIYVLPNLTPGPYRLQVSKAGFKTLIKPDIVLNIQDALSINFALPVGASFEIVTVESGASMINTTDASVSTVVDQEYIKNMPLNGRSFQDLILLTPGVTTQSPQFGYNGNAQLGQNGEFSVNGQRTESNNYTVDGVSGNVGAAPSAYMLLGAGASGSVAASTALGTTQALVSVDDLQEFRVQSSTYSAEYGRNPGGQFAFETKSGTNQWHGTASDYLRNAYFDANDWFNDYFGVREPSLRQNDFGGTVGGPVRVPALYNGKDKTFVFVSYEGLRLNAPQAGTASFVPDLCMRGLGPCPPGRNPAASALLPVIQAFPLPSPGGLEDPTNGFGQFIGSWSNPASLNSTSIRFDHAVNDGLRVFFRFSDAASNSATRSNAFPDPTSDQILAYDLRTYTAGATAVFSSRLSNEFRLNYSSNEATNNQVIDALGGSTPVSLVQLSGLPGSLYLCWSECFDIQEGLTSGTQRQWNLVETMSLSLGRHQLRFGVDYRRLTPFTQPIAANDYIYSSEPSVETNNATVYAEVLGSAYPLYKNLSTFAQDEWKVSQRLSLSMGLRWEVNPAPGVTKGLKPYTVQGSGPSTWTLAPQGAPLWQTTWFNFAPRLGIAYVLQNTPDRATVIRAGGGVFFDTGQQNGSVGFSSGPGFFAESVFAGSFPGSLSSLPVIVNPPVAGTYTPYGFAPHLQLPYTLQWNTSIEQALGKSQALTVSYVGSHAARLLESISVSTSTNPNASEFQFTENGHTSDYDALQIQFRRRLTSGLTVLASYTWSHCLDYGSSNLDFGYQRGNCDFDIRHNLSAAFSYDLPNEGHKGFAKALLHNWGLDDRFTARTAFPVTLDGNTILDPRTLQQYHAGLNLVPGQPVYLYGSNCASVLQGLGDLAPGKECPGGRAINPNAFSQVTSGFGDAPRNFARGFGAWQMDLAVRRNFPIFERLKLQFRAEVFNIFNHPNFGNVQEYGPTFGQATATLASSLGVLSPLYQMGGPRSAQFALKFIF
jgi:hypothetical protein